MKLSELHQWFFEVVGILVPGATALLLVLTFALNPSYFGSQLPTPVSLSTVLQPFASQLLSAVFLFAVTFAAGHLTQQLSVYLLQLHARVFRLSHQNLITEVFSNEAVKQFLVPQKSLLDTSLVHLTPNDYFMMIYPDLAGKTKRETFISISAFCGAMAIVTLIGLLLFGVSSVATHPGWSTDT